MRTQNDMLWVAGIILSAGGLAGGCVGVPEPDLATEDLVTFGVNSTSDYPDSNLGDGICRAGGCDTPILQCCTLRAAIMEANADPTTPRQIDLGAGVFRVSIPPTPGQDEASGDLDLRSHQIIIRGVGAGRTRIVASSGERVFHAQYCESASLMDLSIEGGRAAMGGGLLSDHACRVRLENVRVAENSAAEGGGIANGPNGIMELDHVDVRSNHATGRGGGIANEGTFSMTRSTLANNTSAKGAAGAYLDGRTRVDRSTFSTNLANYFAPQAAGGIHVAGYSTLTNITVSGNDGFPGGVLVTGTAELTHATIADNQIGLMNDDDSGTTMVTASILYDPSYPACAGTIYTFGFNIDNGDTCMFWHHSDRTHTDPMLGDLASDLGPTAVRPLGPSSPAYDMVSRDFAATDQRGVSRDRGRGDAGSYETLGDRFCVNSLGDEVDARPGDGACLTARETCTLRAAVMETNALPGPDGVSFCVRGVIELRTIGANEDDAATGDLDILDDLAIHGAGVRRLTINGYGADRIFDIGPRGENIGVEISNLTILGGEVTGGGGGAAVHDHASLRLANARLLNSGSHATIWATSGGGIRSWGNLDLLRVAIEKNEAASPRWGSIGGGISSSGVLRMRESSLYANSVDRAGGGLYSDGFAELSGVRVEGNSAYAGGGIVNAHALSVLDSTMVGNFAVAEGGALWVGVPASIEAIHTRLERVTLMENENQLVLLGAAVHANNDIDIVNSTVSGNIGGPALYFADAATLTNVTIANNDGGVAGRTIEAVNSIFGSTSGLHPVCSARILSLGYNIDVGGSCRLGDPTDQSNTDPRLLSLADNGGLTWTHEIMSSSPAVDRGDDHACTDTDQRGMARVGICDIGAYEVR